MHLRSLVVGDVLGNIHQVLDEASKGSREKPSAKPNAGDTGEGNSRLSVSNELGTRTRTEIPILTML